MKAKGIDLPPHVVIVGAGLSGAACAQALVGCGVSVELRERGRAPGGRMASPSIEGRRTDVGAAYLTAKEPQFVTQVESWAGAGLVRRWTDSFDVYSADGHTTTSGPTRYGTPQGLRSLVRAGLPGQVTLTSEVRDIGELDCDAVVLAMPDPQAARLAPDAADWVEYEPVVAVVAGWQRRCWPIQNAAFVNDDPDISFVADDGSRRGDRAPVLVVHTTAARARRHLDRPADAITPVLAALRRVVGVTEEPQWTHAHRWTFAKPVGTHGDSPYGLVTTGDRPLGLCGDSWCPSGAPRVESAWLSGSRLGNVLAAHLFG